MNQPGNEKHESQTDDDLDLDLDLDLDDLELDLEEAAPDTNASADPAPLLQPDDEPVPDTGLSLHRDEPPVGVADKDAADAASTAAAASAAATGGAAALAVPISLGLLAAVPALASYVGFSGVAHGLFVLALWPLAVKGDWIARGCLLYLLGKLGWEMMFGAAVIDSAWIGGAVIVEAHSFGALAAVAGLALAAWLDARGASRR